MRRALFSTVLLLLCAPVFAQVKIAWAHGAVSQGPTDPAAKAAIQNGIVGPPDWRTGRASASNFLYVVWFNAIDAQPTPKPTTPVPYTCLSDFGLAAADLAEYDVIAFEGNSRHNDVFESSVWMLTDGTHAVAGSYSEDTCDPKKQHQCTNHSPSSPLKFKSGTVPDDKLAAFAACFHLDLAKRPKDVAGHVEYLHVSWLLIDVPEATGVDVNSNDFRLWMSGAPLGANGTPDPDAFGVIRHK